MGCVMININGQQAWLLVFVFGGFLLDWLAIAFHWKRLKPITKLYAMILVIFWTLSALGWKVELFGGLLVAAQILGLIGDVFLLFSDHWFLWGLISFLIGHVFYIVLNVLLIVDQIKFEMPENKMLWIVFCVTLWLMILLIFYSVLGPKYKKQHGRDYLWIAIQFYFWVLSGLAVISFLAVLLRPLLLWRYSVLPLGTLLFLTSDVILATNRFIQSIDKAQIKVRITYHLAQILLAIGFVELGYGAVSFF
jgi:alkenylglycerophosphocholine hydrolase